MKLKTLNTLSLAAALTLSLLPGSAQAQTTPPATSPAQAPPAAAAPAPAPDPTPGQTAKPPASADQPYVLPTVRVNLVNLVFTVTDKNGRFIKDMKRENFGLLDDGRPPASVVSFTQQTNLPLRIGIMLDTSSSIRTRFKFEQQAALDFFRQVLHQSDRAFVEGFDVQIALTQDYTANPALLDDGISKLRPGGGTALFDALYKTCRDQMLTLKDTTDIRKAIVLVSDGDDNYSRASQTDAIKMCQRADTIVYAISTDTSPTRGRGADVLTAIAAATGGQPFFPTKLEDMVNGFRNIEEELRSQYSLDYRPAEFKQDGSFRTIYLQTTDRRYKVRSRTGYFAPRAAQ